MKLGSKIARRLYKSFEDVELSGETNAVLKDADGENLLDADGVQLLDGA